MKEAVMKTLGITREFRLLAISLIMCLHLTGVVAAATEIIENPKACTQCGMDRAAYARSRMLLVYDDGTKVGVCSLHCAAEEIKQHRGTQLKSIMVADYSSKELTDAKTAIWVVGGRMNGGMNIQAKWAFAREEDARNFVKKNGGEVTTFDLAFKAANEELESATHTGHDHSAHMGPGAQMLYNPAFGDDIYHTHPAGMWMTSYKFMHTSMHGLQSGTENTSIDTVIPSRYMMAPTDMSMDMHMFMLMYGVTDRFTLMGVATYVVNRMDMLMNMGMGDNPMPEMQTSGMGDTELRGIYKINEYLVASLGFSIPTGDINQTFTTMGMTFRAPYDMQLGSGTVDLKPALTANFLSEDRKWNWGSQAMYTYHVGENNNHYSLGNSVKLTGWLQRAIGPASTWFRLAYSNTDRIQGADPEIQKLLDPVMGAPTPDADPGNYGGQRLDGLIGVSFTEGTISLGIEGGIPFYQNLNGLQLKTQWLLTAGLQAMF
jgi:nitrous oxide reductase accessory protein NosL